MPRRLLNAARLTALVALASVAALANGCSRAPDAAGRWQACRLPGLSEPAECTRVRVFEDRARGAGRTLEIHIAKLAATRAVAEPDPIVFIAGGPGQAASSVARHVLPGLRRARRTRDLLFVDLRGTGRSGALACSLSEGSTATYATGAAPIGDLFAPEMPADRIAACAASYDADLRRYTTANAVDDLEQARRALGLGRVNAIGVSYGTRVVLTWMRRHPESLRTAVLDSVAPPQMPLFVPFARDAQRAWGLLVRDCRADKTCAARFPEVDRLLERALAAAEPARAVRVEHPVSGLPTSVTLTRAGVAMAVRGLLYSSELSALLPLALERAAAGDWRTLVSQALLLGQGAEETTSVGLLLATVCVEDVPRFGEVALADEVSGTFLGATVVETMRHACQAWTRAARPAAARPGSPAPKTSGVSSAASSAVSSDVPTLLLSGEADPVTPPRWAELAAKTLSRSRHVVFPGLGHSVARHACGPRIIADFFESADPASVRCERPSQRPAFFLSPAGPAP